MIKPIEIKIFKHVLIGEKTVRLQKTSMMIIIIIIVSYRTSSEQHNRIIIIIT